MKVQFSIPNLLTLVRVLMVPVMVWLLLTGTLWNILIAGILYGLSAITDAFDGMIARKLNQVTEFGAYIDPMADKVLVLSVYAAFCFIPDLMIPWWLAVFILLRDLFITYLRNYSRKKNIRFKTSMVAKAKTLVQMIVIAAIMAFMFITRLVQFVLRIPETSYAGIWKSAASGSLSFIIFLPLVLTIIVVLFTIYTGLDYYLVYKKEKDLKNAE